MLSRKVLVASSALSVKGDIIVAECRSVGRSGFARFALSGKVR